MTDTTTTTTTPPCILCRMVSHDLGGHFAEAFTNPTTREPFDVPADIKEAAVRICRAYGINGIADPMYVANVIALETGRGDGCSTFVAVTPQRDDDDVQETT